MSPRVPSGPVTERKGAEFAEEMGDTLTGNDRRKLEVTGRVSPFLHGLSGSRVLPQLFSPITWLKSALIHAEEWWFDFSHHVKTAGSVPLAGMTLAGRREDGFMYGPAAVRSARQALRDIPVQDHSRFTFIDFGSGKGRILFLAAEYPYREILGVEFAQELHLQAQRNISSYRSSYRGGKKQRCRRVTSSYLDAGAFDFPEGDLVLYMFNPFPPPTLERVLGNLKWSLEQSPREVFIVLQYPQELAHVLESSPWLKASTRSPRYHIYHTV